ncbi:MAG TPA: PAS domain S-box protein, partial [Anaerolineales bacterium]|nr:PAS domain S-box protein [Anaerolineales bacterium]
MKISGKPKTPIIAAQSKEKRDQQASSVNGNKGGTKARTSRTSKSKTNGVKSVVLERISDGILALDAGLTYTYLNERAGELLGCKSDELIGRSLWQAHPDADGAPLAEACRRALETQTIVPLDGYFPASDRWLAGRVYPSAEGVSVLFMEGTQRKWEEIRDTSSLPEQNPNPVLRFTPQGEILYANPSAKTLLRAWENQDAQTTSLSEIQLLLPSVTDEGLTTDIEIVNEGKVYTGLLVPVKEHGYINLYLRDITERKQVEESLRAHINQTNAGITRTDLDGRFTFANQAFCDLLGYSEDELLGKTIWEISHSEDVAKNERLFERMVREGRSFQLEKRALRRNGSVLWVSVGTSPLRDAAGTIRAATSIVVDITRRKRAEESLLDSARRTLYLSSLSDAMRPLSDPSTIQIEALRLLGAHLKASRVAYIEMEPDGRAFVRDSYVDGIGKMGEQFNIDTFIPQSQRMDFRAGRVISASDVQSDSRFSESQKAEHESLGIAAEILYPFVRAGEVIAALCIQQSQPRAWKNEELSLVRETGERLQAAIEHAHAERKLRDSERRFRILSNTVPSVVWTASPNGTIEYANDIWYNYAGITPEQNATNWAELVLHPDDYERCVRAWTHALETVPDEYLIEVRNRRHDGVYRWFQTRAIPVRDEHGSVTAWYGVTTDIHERKAIEQEKNDLLEREQTLRLDAEQARIEAEQSKIKAEEELVERKLAEQALGQWADAPLPQETRSPWLRYGMAFAATAAAIGLRMLLDPVLGEYVQYTLLFAAVAFSVWYGGLGPALFSAIFGYLGISWFIMDWQHILNPNAADLTGFVIFLFSTVIIMFLGSAMRRAQRHAHQSARVAVARQRQAELHLIEQKRVEEALRESEQRFRDIFETAGVSVWVEDFSAVTQAIEELRTQGVQDFRAYFLQHPDFVRKAVDLVQILDVNQETLRLFGAKNKDELLHSLSNVFLPETEAVFLEELVTLAEGQAVMRAETQLHTLDDRLITVLFTVHFNPQVGDTRRVVVTLTDITERKHMEQALEHEKQLFKLLFETMPVMVSLYDPESNTLRLNAEFERALGWRDEEVTVQSLLEYLYPDIEYRNQILQRMAAAGRNDWVEVQVQARDGRTLDSLWSNISIMNDKQIVSGIAIGIDITERKQDELALRQYARQQEALYELTNRLQHTKSQEDIYNAAQDAILYALQCDRASILLFDDTDAMHFVAWRGLSDEYRTATDGHSPWKRDEKDPEPISMADIDAAELSDSLKAIIKEEGIASLAFIPLVSNGQLIGKFMAYFNTPHDWSDREIDLGQTIARQLATAVERKRADDALHASEERFAQFMQYLPGLAWIKDIQGRYVFANAAAEQAFGTLREELYGRTDAEVFP